MSVALAEGIDCRCCTFSSYIAHYRKGQGYFQMPPLRQTKEWVDRFGRTHRELSPVTFPTADLRAARVPGPIEKAWAQALSIGGEQAARQCGDMAVAALAQPNPIITEDPEGDPDMRLYTWVVESPGATAVLMWANGVFDHDNVTGSEMRRLEGSDLWTLTLRMPADWRASYTITSWDHDETPPWRAATGRMEIRRAAMADGRLDERNIGRVMNSSLVEGPVALADRWAAASQSTCTDEHVVDGVRYWVYAPETSENTPLLILFDGQHWNGPLNLPRQLDAAIRSGALPPVHVVMLDSRDVDHRWENVGVPGGQVDVLIDAILPHVRATYRVSPSGEDTIISGASIGGLACLWALALSDGEIGHAIAQSPSLWRFDIADALSAAENWVSIHLQAGEYESEMLRLSHKLAEDLSGDIRDVRVRAVTGGHDWAWWRVHMLNELTRLLSGR